jgi:biopolymer transport protein ExbB
MWPILGIGAIGLIFVGERLYHLISGLQANESFAVDVAKITAERGFDSALDRCEEVVGPVANLCYNALENASKGVEGAEKALEQTISIEMASLEKNMTWISLCIATAPMLGFLGTVWGMVSAFDAIAAADNISAKIVAEGISQALLTTAFGLVVAVILQILQNTVLYIIDNQIVSIQKSVNSYLKSVEKFSK